MDKAIMVGFELLMFLVMVAVAAVFLSAPWPVPLAAILPMGGMALIGMIILDVARS